MIYELAPLTQLTHLELEDCHELTDVGIAFIAHTFPLLEVLYVTENIWKNTDASWCSFAMLTRLRELELGYSHHLTHAGLLSFVQQASHTFREARYHRALLTSEILPSSPLILSMTCLSPGLDIFSLYAYGASAKLTLTLADHMKDGDDDDAKLPSSVLSLRSFLLGAQTSIPSHRSPRREPAKYILASHIYPLSALHLTSCACSKLPNACPHRQQQEQGTQTQT